jgi:hypothetical protein
MNETTRKYAYRLSYDELTAHVAEASPQELEAANKGGMKAHVEGISAAELKAADKCGSDAVLLASILYPPDGSLSVLFRSLDGRTGEELADNEWFKIFTLLASRLGKSTTLSESKRRFAEYVFETFRQAMMAGRCNDENCTGHHDEDKPEVTH